MESTSELLVNVVALPLDDGTMFHAKRIGLPYFRVPVSMVVKEEFTLVTASADLT
jgi:hypothetical protein